MHAPSNKDLQQPPNVPPDMDITGAPDGNHTPDPVVTLAITRDDFQVAAAPNAAPESLKKFPTNKALIEAVNNLFLETYESFTGKARMTGSGETKRLIIHFYTAEARDLCVGSSHPEFSDLIFHAHNLRQLRSNKDLRAIQMWQIRLCPKFLSLKQTRGRSRTHDPVAKLKKRFNVNQPSHRSNPNAANSRSRSRSRSKSKDRLASNSRRDNNNSHDYNNNVNNHNIPNPNTSQRAWHNIANFHKRISALELADQQMTRIETHLGLDPLPTPNEPDLDLMQDDAPTVNSLYSHTFGTVHIW
ncbi:hypothetical protein RhiirA1_481391 [Rhizophagus irregularis]|uniref:Uncharacterized protein n=1 Tax=Rhizophagus irregularis TaxID=588596 RepID=A0A2N0QN57_9GLOM|nr:hypothetical protein RhiirA1_481391 [Rhizophagus irregularis]